MESVFIISIINSCLITLISCTQLYIAYRTRYETLVQRRFDLWDDFIQRVVNESSKMNAKRLGNPIYEETEEIWHDSVWKLTIENDARELRTIFPDEVYYFAMDIASKPNLEWVEQFSYNKEKNPGMEVITLLRSKFDKYYIYQKEKCYHRLWRELKCECNK